MVTSTLRKSLAKPVVRVPTKVAAAAAKSTAKSQARLAGSNIKKAPSAAPVPAKKLVASRPAVLAKPAAATSKATTNGSAAKPVAPKTPKIRPVEKIKKAKLVRDSFTMPETEYEALSEVKKACLKAGFEVKKSELLRIGVALVRKLALSSLKQEVAALAPLKPGRPRKEKAAEK